MTNLGYQLDCIYNQLKHTLLEMLVRGYLTLENEPKSGPHLLVAASCKDVGKGIFASCLFDLSHTGK